MPTLAAHGTEGEVSREAEQKLEGCPRKNARTNCKEGSLERQAGGNKRRRLHTLI